MNLADLRLIILEVVVGLVIVRYAQELINKGSKIAL